MKRTLLAIACMLLLMGCGVRAPVEPGPSVTQARPIVRRGFAPRVEDRRLLAGICYGPFRKGQRPEGPHPSRAQLLEDLTIIARRWGMIRIYSSRGSAEAILEVLQTSGLPVRVIVGAWIAPDALAENDIEVTNAVRLANAYPEQVLAISVGNETQVAWSAHRSARTDLIRYIRQVRVAVQQPVTTADDYNFWNKPESHAVAAEIDFMLLHAYAMWNGQQLPDAVAWTERTVAAIRANHPELTIVLGETGWATQLNREGSEVKHIKAPAGEAEQAAFFAALSEWAQRAEQPHFYFEAFDEQWKGGDDSRDVEKHWGLYRDDRTPKAAVSEAVQ